MERPTKLKRSHYLARILCTLTLCFGLVFAMAGCSSGPQQSPSQSNNSQATRTFTDSLGRQVTVPEQVTAIAASGPLAQQVLLTIAPQKLVGLATAFTADQTKYIGAQYASLPVFGQIYGGKGDFNKEAVSQAHPQVIIDIGEAKGSIKEDLDKLQGQVGIPVVHINATLQTYDTTYTMLGDLLGDKEKAKELADYCAAAYKETTDVMATIPVEKRANMLYCVGASGQNVIAKGSYQAGVVDLVANNLAVVEKPSGSGTGNEASLEQIALWNPSLIVFSADSIYSTVGDDATWATMPAIANNAYYQAPGAPYNWLSGPPSVNQVIGLQWLPRLLYPSSFSTGIEDVAVKYYKTFYNYDLSAAECKELVANATPKS